MYYATPLLIACLRIGPEVVDHCPQMQNSSGRFERKSNENALAHCDEYRRHQRRATRSKIRCPKTEIGGNTATRSTSPLKHRSACTERPKDKKGHVRGWSESERAPTASAEAEGPESPREVDHTTRERVEDRGEGESVDREANANILAPGPRAIGEACTGCAIIDSGASVYPQTFASALIARSLPLYFSASSSHCTRRAAAAVRYTADGRRTSHVHPQTKPAARRMGAACVGLHQPSHIASPDRLAPRSAHASQQILLGRSTLTAHEDHRLPQPRTTHAHRVPPCRWRKRGMRSGCSFETAAHEARRPERAPILTSSRKGETPRAKALQAAGGAVREASPEFRQDGEGGVGSEGEGESEAYDAFKSQARVRGSRAVAEARPEGNDLRRSCARRAPSPSHGSTTTDRCAIQLRTCSTALRTNDSESRSRTRMRTSSPRRVGKATYRA
ncbi:hypothetical protein B0H14DRAFT_2645784 [Mycena olivaceomarginata]|nr:hypothetical protein B0H14DRAFT_2645784 [Mycena olivaceomarginata]